MVWRENTIKGTERSCTVNYLHNVLYYLRNLIVATPKMKMVMETHPRMV